MKKRRAVWIMTFIGILLALSCVVLGKALVAECAQMNGDYSMQKVLVSVKNQIDRQGKSSFSIDDIKKLKKGLSTEDISYTAQSGLVNTPVSNGSTFMPVRMTGVDHMYPVFSGLTLEEGSFITQKQEEEGAMVAVIDYDLAQDIFKTADVTGRTLEIYGGVFRITGVVKKDNTLIEKLTDDGLPDVYIPASVMLELDTTSQITALQIKTAEADTLDQNTDKVSLALQQIGKVTSNYNISDYNIKFELMKQLPLIFAFILGIAAIFTLLFYVKNLIKKLYFLIRDGCKIDFLSNVIKNNLVVIGMCLLEMVLALTGVVLIWLGIRFRLYIPLHFIPDELINISYYSDLIKGLIQGDIQSMGYIAPHSELLVNTINAILNVLFCISVVLGLLILYTGFRELRTLNVNSNRLTIVFGLFFIIALFILAIVAFWAELPFLLDVQSILVVWAFIYIKILFIKRKESGINV